MNGAEVIAGRFAIVRPLARGNMGQVCEALDERTGEKVAVKTMLRRRNGELVSLREADKNALRFQREVRIMSRLHSDNLPRIIDGGLDGDQPYLAMEYVPGMTLADLIAKEDRLRVAWAAAIGAQIAAGLAVAHRASVVHRDLKPSNVMITPDGVVKVLDFGVGLILDDVDGEPLTSSGVTLGTARYMSPEQAKAEAVTPATDLYALGCVLYEMLAGASPFDGETAYELMSQQVEQAPLPVSGLRSEVPEALGQLVSRLLEKDPANRPADADEVAAALRPFVLASGTPVPGPDPTRPILSADVTKEAETRPSATTSAELKAAAEGEFDIFDVHRRLISDYRAFTEGAAVIRDPRIAKFMEADLDAKSQWPDPWLSLNPFFADGGSVTDLVDSGLLHPECARIFQTGKTPGGTVCDGRPIRFYQHQREAIEAAGTGCQLRAHHRHGLGQVAGVHGADRGPRAAGQGDRPAAAGQGDHRLPDERPGQQPDRRAGEVPAGRLPAGRITGDVRALHRAGEPGGPGPHPREPAGHPADQLRDAGAAAHPAR